MSQEQEKPTKAKRKTLTKEEKIQALKDKEKQIKAKIARLEYTDKEKQRKEDARRKIIVGGTVIAMMKEDKELAKKIVARLHLTIKRQSDRELLGIDKEDSNQK